MHGVRPVLGSGSVSGLPLKELTCAEHKSKRLEPTTQKVPIPGAPGLAKLFNRQIKECTKNDGSRMSHALILKS